MGDDTEVSMVENEVQKGGQTIMLEGCRNAQERWGGVHQLVDRWLQSRHELLQTFNQVKNMQQVDQEVLRTFCQLLMDYLSAGHFGVYEQLIEECRAFDDEDGLKVAEQILPRLQTITDHVVQFNDRQDRGDCSDPVWVASELDGLDRHLRERFELEDCMIELLHNVHGQDGREKEILA